jgi:hypothetical protein
MISYLASGRAIVYHGPAMAAAGRLLSASGAALCMTTLDASAVAAEFGRVMSSTDKVMGIAAAAMELARERFSLLEIRARFWHRLATLAKHSRASLPRG